jgi:hypothetical protein
VLMFHTLMTLFSDTAMSWLWPELHDGAVKGLEHGDGHVGKGVPDVHIVIAAAFGKEPRLGAVGEAQDAALVALELAEALPLGEIAELKRTEEFMLAEPLGSLGARDRCGVVEVREPAPPA